MNDYEDAIVFVLNYVEQIVHKKIFNQILIHNSFLCDFYTEALADCLINLFSEKKKYNQKQIIDYIMIILQNSIPAILKQASLDKSDI